MGAAKCGHGVVLLIRSLNKVSSKINFSEMLLLDVARELFLHPVFVFWLKCILCAHFVHASFVILSLWCLWYYNILTAQNFRARFFISNPVSK